LSGIFNFPGFKFNYVALDLMHISDLGTLQYTLANCLLELYRKMGGTTEHKSTNSRDVLHSLLTFIKLASKRVGQEEPPIRGLTFLMIAKDFGKTAPKLATKAAETRRLLPCILFICREIFPPTNEHERVHICVKLGARSVCLLVAEMYLKVF